MRNRLSFPLVAVVALLAVPATAFSSLARPTQASVDLPGVPGVQTVQVCTQSGGTKPSCKKVQTPDIERGRVSLSWNTGLGTRVLAVPTSPFPKQCGGRPGAGITATVGRAATDVSMAFRANYAGVSARRTLVSVRRSVDPAQGVSIWACLL